MTMDAITASQAATWSIAAFATSGVILRPWGLPEAIWAVAGATALVLSALLPWQDALAAVSRGTDVYLFLTGMMLLAEVARREGLFDWLAVHATEAAKGSPARLFGLIYVVGIIVTAFLSNDATAVVLTPAVYAAAKAAKAKPLPYLVVCAFIANAASFVLPISNPANLVLYGNHIPALWPWLKQFALPSILSIAATYAVLRFLVPQGLERRNRNQGRRFRSFQWRPLCGLRHRSDRRRSSSSLGARHSARRADLRRRRCNRRLCADREEGNAVAAHARRLLGRPSACSRSFRSGSGAEQHRRRRSAYRTVEMGRFAIGGAPPPGSQAPVSPLAPISRTTCRRP